MKRDNGKNRKEFSKAKLILGIGFTALTVLSQGYAIYKERQGDLSSTFPEAETEISEAIECVRREKEAELNE